MSEALPREDVEIKRIWLDLADPDPLDITNEGLLTITIESSIEKMLETMVEAYRINSYKMMEQLRTEYPDSIIKISPWHTRSSGTNTALNIGDHGFEIVIAKPESDESYQKRLVAHKIKEEKLAKQREEARKKKVAKLLKEAQELGLTVLESKTKEG